MLNYSTRGTNTWNWVLIILLCKFDPKINSFFLIILIIEEGEDTQAASHVLFADDILSH